MEITPTRRATAFFFAALLALSLVPFTQVAYADSPSADNALESVDGIDASVTAEPSTAADPSDVSNAPAENALGALGSGDIGALAQPDRTVGTFAELQAAIAAITADSDPQGTIIIGQSFSFDSAIEINVPCTITIKGGGNTLTAETSRHFALSNGADITVTDVVFDGATAAGGIDVGAKGALALERTTMQNCTALPGSNGGALQAISNSSSDVARVTISDNCVFKGNQAPTTSAGRGGAMSLGQNTVFSMSDSSFESNTTSQFGGAVCIRGGNSQIADATFTNVSFEGNKSISSQGGGVLVENYATVVFDDCSFVGNTAYSNGGGMQIEGISDVTIKDSEFLNNEAIGSGMATAGGIGVNLDRTNASFTMAGTTVDGNKSVRGGGIRLARFTNYLISDCTISNNTATADGGGIYVAGPVEGTLPVSLMLIRSEVSGNTAENGGGLFGEVGRNYDTQIILQSTTFSNNAATVDGGGVYMEDDSLVGLFADAATVFSGNTAATLHELTDPALIATHNTHIFTNAFSTTDVPYAYSNFDVNQVLGVPFAMATVEYKSNGGTGSDFSEAVVASSTYHAKTAAELGFSKGTDEFLYWTTTADPDDPTAVTYQEGDTVALPNDGSTVTLYAQWKAADPTPTNKMLSVARLFGVDRYETSAQVSTYERDITAAQTIIIASGADYNFPDSLSASSLSGANDNAPILLTEPTELPDAARATLVQATSAAKVYIIGDRYAVSEGVEAEIASLLPNTQIERLGGEGRQETAELIFEELGSSASKTAILARSMNFPDSLSASPWAALTKSPIFLTNFDERSIKQGTLDALAAGGFDRLIVLGDQYSIPEAVAAEARDAAGLTDADVVRLGGDDRMETALLLAQWATDPARGSEALSWDNLALTRDDKHPDALSGGALQGMHGSVILLTPTNEVRSGVLAAITAAGSQISEIRFFGDEYSIAHATMRAYIGAIPHDTVGWKPDNSVAIDL